MTTPHDDPDDPLGAPLDDFLDDPLDNSLGNPFDELDGDNIPVPFYGTFLGILFLHLPPLVGIYCDPRLSADEDRSARLVAIVFSSLASVVAALCLRWFEVRPPPSSKEKRHQMAKRALTTRPYKSRSEHPLPDRRRSIRRFFANGRRRRSTDDVGEISSDPRVPFRKDENRRRRASWQPGHLKLRRDAPKEKVSIAPARRWSVTTYGSPGMYAPSAPSEVDCNSNASQSESDVGCSGGGPPSCAICVVDFVDGDAVSSSGTCAQHTFHHECIVLWLERSDVCPLCRRDVMKERKNK